MKRITSIVLLALVSTFAIAQKSQDSLREKAVLSIKEKFPETRIFNFEYNQSLDRSFSSELLDQEFQEGDIKSQRNFKASANIPVYKTQKWSFTASMFYQFREFEFENIENPSSMPLFERNGIVNFHNFSAALSSTYFSILFKKPVIFNASIIADANEVNFGRFKGLLGFTFILKQTERTTITLGAIGFIDPSSQIPFTPTFSYNHRFKNSTWELDFILPQRLLFRRPVGDNGRLSLGSRIGASEFYIDVNDQAYGNVFAYSQIELKTGIMYEHRINDYLITTFQGGLQNFISNRATEKGEPTQDFIYENKQDATGYFQIGISIDPFSKNKN
ncbi:MAG: hypothetical protein V7719_14395 [Psychroserpens sp.]|uniref:hypothetical protein n=1 Tax=Psychroserpens sp. TaxID=2020870 RepID=UPI0030031087